MGTGAFLKRDLTALQFSDGFDRAVFRDQNHFRFWLRGFRADVNQIGTGGRAKIGGISPVLPRSMLPTFSASSIWGPAGNSTSDFAVRVAFLQQLMALASTILTLPFGSRCARVRRGLCRMAQTDSVSNPLSARVLKRLGMFHPPEGLERGSAAGRAVQRLPEGLQRQVEASLQIRRKLRLMLIVGDTLSSANTPCRISCAFRALSTGFSA